MSQIELSGVQASIKLSPGRPEHHPAVCHMSHGVICHSVTYIIRIFIHNLFP